MRRARIVHDLVDHVPAARITGHASPALLPSLRRTQGRRPIVNGSLKTHLRADVFNIAAGVSSLKGWQVTGEGIDIVTTSTGRPARREIG